MAVRLIGHRLRTHRDGSPGIGFFTRTWPRCLQIRHQLFPLGSHLAARCSIHKSDRLQGHDKKDHFPLKSTSGRTRRPTKDSDQPYRRTTGDRFNYYQKNSDEHSMRMGYRRKTRGSMASRVTRPQSPWSAALIGTSQDPPTQITSDNARNSGAFCSVMPPVGQNFTSKSGPPQALSMAPPPACSAGENLHSATPSCCVSMISLVIAMPGNNGRPTSRQACPSSLSDTESQNLPPLEMLKK